MEKRSKWTAREGGGEREGTRRWVRVLWVLLLGIALAPTLWAADETFMATLKNDSRGVSECLLFKGNGGDKHPQRYNWGPGDYCGYPGGKQEVIANRQALWTFVHLGNNEYVIKNSSRGPDECLIFAGDGHDTHPQRYNWGPGPYCGFSGGVEALRANGQAVWKLTQLDGNQYMITNASRGQQECLIFSGGGHNTFPERYNWGPGSYCGFPGGRDGLLANRQGVFTIERHRIDDMPIPQAWLDNFLILQNARFGYQRLHVGHNGNGQLYAQWGEDRAFRWTVEPAHGDGHFFYLRSAEHGQRLHVGHNGNGQLYAQWGYGDDDAFRWAAEPASGGNYHFRNKMYPHQRLRVGDDGQSRPSAAWGTNSAFEWKVMLLPSSEAPADPVFRASRFLQTQALLIENVRYDSQRLHVGHNGNGQLYAEPGDDLAFQWKLRTHGTDGYHTLSNYLYPNQYLRVSSDGSGGVSAGPFSGDASLWRVEPKPGNQLMLRNRAFPDQRLHVGHDGNGQLYAEWGDDNAYAWRLRHVPPPDYGWFPRDEPCPQHMPEGQQAIKVCFYPGTNQAGPPRCVVHDDHRDAEDQQAYLGEVNNTVIHNARSVRAEICGGSTRPPKVFLYKMMDQRSETDVIDGQGNLGATWGEVRSYQVMESSNSQTPRYVCLYTQDNWQGRKHCAPLKIPTHSYALSDDFDDSVASVRAFPHWGCTQLQLWQHFNQSGQRIDVGADENLKNRPIAITLLEWKRWSQVVSTYKFRYLNGAPFC
ncbi:MAG: RICIN domain-containing protein [Acidobacteriota bacterium]